MTLNRNLLIGGPLIVALLVVVGPADTDLWGVGRRLVFWSLVTAASLGCVLLAARWLTGRAGARLGLWPRLLLSVALGGALYAPLSLGLEYAFVPPASIDVDDWRDRVAQRNVIAAVAVEYTEFMPALTLCWLLLNLPVISRDERGNAASDPSRPGARRGVSGPERNGPADAGVSRPGDAPAPARSTESAAPERPTRGDDEPAARTQAPDPGDTAASPDAPPQEGFFAALPPAIGTDVISVSADLHYLTVHTAAGKATIWFALRDAVAELGQRGLQIHRSHWVARDHVRRVRRSGGRWRIELSDGRHLPVSRRRRAAVRETLGTDFTAA